ncbi:hypothetical protein ACG7TL_007618 [Trametes sanguinea]
MTASDYTSIAEGGFGFVGNLTACLVCPSDTVTAPLYGPPIDMPLKIVKIRKVTADDALNALVATSAVSKQIADIMQFPPAQAAAGILLLVFETIQKIQANKDDCYRLAQRCLSTLVDIRDHMTEHQDSAPPSLLKAITKFEEALESIYKFMKQEAEQTWGTRLMRKGTIELAMKRHHLALDDAVRSFQLSLGGIPDRTKAVDGSMPMPESAEGPESSQPSGTPQSREATPPAYSEELVEESFAMIEAQSSIGSISSEYEMLLSAPGAQVDAYSTVPSEVVEDFRITEHQGVMAYMALPCNSANRHLQFNQYHQSQFVMKGKSRIKSGWWGGGVEGDLDGRRSFMLRYEGNQRDAMKILPGGGYAREPVDVNDQSGATIEKQRKISHLTMIARTLLPDSENLDVVKKRLRDVLTAEDEEDEEAEMSSISLRQLRMAALANGMVQQAWHRNTVPPNKYAVGDLGYLPPGSNDWSDFVFCCNIYQDGSVNADIESRVAGMQGSWIKGGGYDRQELTPFDYPGGISGWPVVVLPEADFTLHIDHEVVTTQISVAWNYLLENGRSLAAQYGVGPEELILVSRVGCEQRFRVRDLRKVRYWPASMNLPPHPHRHRQQHTFPGHFGHQSFGSRTSGGEERRLVQGQDLAPKLFYLFTSGDKHYQSHFSQRPMPSPLKEGEKAPELDANVVQCFAYPTERYTHDDTSMDAERQTSKTAIEVADEQLLASLGYKQEFQRAFTGLEWLVASIFILFVGMSMAELASAAPTSGGLYFWTHSLSSPRWRNLLAWIVGYWGCAVQITAAASIGSGQAYSATNAQTLLCLAVIIALPAATPKEFRNSASYALGNFTNSSFDSSVHISEEASNAATAVPWAIVYAIGIAGVLGWAINVALAFCMGTDLDSLMNSPIGQPMAEIFFNSFGQKGTLALWSIVVLVQYMMGSSMLLAASRQSFAFSRDGALPFSNWLYRMNAYTGTPVNTVWFVAIFSILLGLLAFAGDSAINAIFAMSITALYIAYAIPIAARFLGKNDFKPGPFNLGMWSAPVAAIAVLWMLFMGVVFLFPTSPNPAVPDMNYTIVVLGGVMILSLIWYYFPKYGGVHWFTGPVKTITNSEPEEQGSGRPSTSDSVEKEKAAVSVVQRETQ